MIRFTCSNCGRHISVDDRYSGRKGKCPKCGGVVRVPKKPAVIAFSCSICDHQIKLSLQYSGQNVQCPECGNEVIVPTAGQEVIEGDHAGHIECPICNQVITTPAGSESTPTKCTQCGCDLESEIELAVEQRRLRFVIGTTALAVIVVVIAVLALILPSDPQPAKDIQRNQTLPTTDPPLTPSTPDMSATTADIADSPGTYLSVDIEIQPNGDVIISEQQRCSVAARQTDAPHERYRWFSTEKLDGIRDVELYELARNGQALPEPVRLSPAAQRVGNQFWIRWQHKPGPTQTLTFFIRYRVIGGLRIEEPVDELHWQAIPPNGSDLIERSRVTVRLPRVLRGHVRRAGSEGGAALNIAPDESYVEFNSLGRTVWRRGLTVIVGFPHGILKVKRSAWQPPEPTIRTRLKKLWANKPVVTLMAILFAICIGADFLTSMCPECHKIWGLRYTGETDKPDKRGWWDFPETMLLYRCNRCGCERWRKRTSGGC